MGWPLWPPVYPFKREAFPWQLVCSWGPEEALGRARGRTGGTGTGSPGQKGVSRAAKGARLDGRGPETPSRQDPAHEGRLGSSGPYSWLRFAG